MYRRANRVIVCWAMGITQHHHSVAIIQEIVNLQLLRGNLGRPGAGLCPVRGHSNVQGDRTMGINERPPAALLDALERRFGFEVPRHNGHNAVEAIAAMLAGKSKVFIGLGGNFAQATPDSPRTHAALASCDLTVHISTKLNRSHLTTGRDALILPCLGRTDIDRQAEGPQAVTVEDSFSMIHASYGQLEPLSQQMRSEPAIIAGIAKATLGNHPVDWDALIANYERIRELIADTIPGSPTSTAASAIPVASTSQLRRRTTLEHRQRQGQLRRQPAAPRPVAGTGARQRPRTRPDPADPALP